MFFFFGKSGEKESENTHTRQLLFTRVWRTSRGRRFEGENIFNFLKSRSNVLFFPPVCVCRWVLLATAAKRFYAANRWFFLIFYENRRDDMRKTHTRCIAGANEAPFVARIKKIRTASHTIRISFHFFCTRRYKDV